MMADAEKKDLARPEETPLNDKKENIKRSYKEKFMHMKNNITVEPLVAGFIIPSMLTKFAVGNFNLDKACRVNLKLGDEICDSLMKNKSGNNSSYELEVQAIMASIDIWRSVINTALPCIIMIFLGAWSDRTGKRKISFILPVFGEILACISNLISVYFFHEIPLEITVFLDSFFPSITGSWTLIFLGVFSYISDITTEKERTFRVGLVSFCMTSGMPIGVAISGVLLKYLGYYAVFSMTLVMYSLVLVYGVFFIKETEIVIKEQGLPPIERKDSSNVSFFDLTHVKETVEVAYKPRQTNKRLRIIFTLFTVFILFGPAMSEYPIVYLYVRNRLNWDLVMYGFYASYSILLHSFGAMFSITILSRRLQVDDALLCLISVSSKFVGSIWTAFVQTDVEMFLVPVVEILNATTFTSLRSIISKLVEKQETAKVNSLFSLTETVAALLFHPLYSWIYMKTLHVFSGAIFIVSAILIIPPSIILTTFYLHHRKLRSQARKQALEEEQRKEEEQKKSPLAFCPVENVDIDCVLAVAENKVQATAKTDKKDTQDNNDTKKES